MGSYSALKKREALINIGMIYLEAVSNLVKETLTREVMEETGFTVRSYSNPRIYDVFVREELKNFMVHHVMALYDVEMNESAPQVTTSEAVSDGANDSLGYIWMDIQEITEENASPLVLKVKSELLGFPELDKTSYMNWKVK